MLIELTLIKEFINEYTHPENFKSVYIYKGAERTILRKAALTGLASEICDKVFSETPTINNEAINKSIITSIANTSRSKIISGLLRNKLEPNLGLSGTGQEVSIMRSTLLRKNVLINDATSTRINLKPADYQMKNVLDQIIAFIMEAKKTGKVSFERLYEKLESPKYHIGLRNGVIPIYIAAVFHEFLEDIIILNNYGQVPLTADTLQAINSTPSDYMLEYLEWNAEKQEFVTKIAEMYNQYVVEAERNLSAYEYAASAMKRWYLSLPRYTKETKVLGEKKVDIRYQKMMRLLKQNFSGQELLFEKLPEVFGYKGFDVELVENIKQAKEYYDSAIFNLKKLLIVETKKMFSISTNKENLDRISLTSVIKDWCETLDKQVFEQLFENGTDRCLGLFKNITNDEMTFISKLAKLTTDLRIEDWDDFTIQRFEENLKVFQNTAREFHSSIEINNGSSTSVYEIRFTSDDGASEVKRFERIESSKKGRLLYNSIMAEIDSMGKSISEQEKRQILMDILKEMC